MVVDWDKGFVFIHVPKTGGSSIQAAIRPKRPSEFLKLRRKLGLPVPLSFAAVSPKTKHETYEDWLAQFTKRTGRPVSEARKLVPILFCRHPVDRFASLHRYLLKKHRETYPDVPEDINAFVDQLREGTAPHLAQIMSLRPQCDFLPADGRAEIGRFETLAEDFKRIFAPFGITAELPRLNTSRAAGQAGDGGLGLTPENTAYLAQRYQQDMETFGY